MPTNSISGEIGQIHREPIGSLGTAFDLSMRVSALGAKVFKPTPLPTSQREEHTNTSHEDIIKACENALVSLYN